MNDNRRTGRRFAEEALEDGIRNVDAAVRGGLPDRPGPVRPVNRDRATLRPPREDVGVGRNPERRGPVGPSWILAETLVDVEAARRRRRGRRPDSDSESHLRPPVAVEG